MRQLLISTALLLAVPTFGAAQGSTCPDGTMTCNIATVGDTDISAPGPAPGVSRCAKRFSLHRRRESPL